MTCEAEDAQSKGLLTHPIPPVFDSSSRILILGSFPSVKSREAGFYYGHPRNRFWPLMEELFSIRFPDIPAKKAFLLDAHIALSDVIQACRIKGSADATITDAVPSDLDQILSSSQVSKVFLNGGKAAELFSRFQSVPEGVSVTRLPSTSPANAAWSFSRLVSAWQAVKEALGMPS